MVLFPNAKINIGLYVVNKRSDGYHDLSTVMIPVPWNDILEIVRTNSNSGIRLFTSGYPIDCPPEKNLVYKAVELLSDFTGKKFDIDIFLRKIVPDGAGLGAGSADGAFTLSILNNLFNLGLSVRELQYISSRLGADCPFFILDKPQLAEGIGERLTPIEVPLRNWKILLVKPPEKISTSQVYASIKPCQPEIGIVEAMKLPVEEWRNHIYNDFERVVFENFPHLKTIKDELYRAGAVYASMSGSGSAFYGLFPPETDNVSALSKHFCNDRTIVHSGVIEF